MSVKLSANTLALLRNYNTINANVLIQKGSSLSTVAIAKNVIAESNITEDFPQEFPIYNLGEFLSALSLFTDPELDFEGSYVTIYNAGKPKGTKLRYIAASKEIITFPENKVREPSWDVEFNLVEADLAQVLKASGVLNAPDLQVVGGPEGLTLRVCDLKTPSANNFELPLSGEAQTGQFTFNIRIENLKLIPGAYDVAISAKGLSKFEGALGNTFIALEASSSHKSN